MSRRPDINLRIERKKYGNSYRSQDYDNFNKYDERNFPKFKDKSSNVFRDERDKTIPSKTIPRQYSNQAPKNPFHQNRLPNQNRRKNYCFGKNNKFQNPIKTRGENKICNDEQKRPENYDNLNKQSNNENINSCKQNESRKYDTKINLPKPLIKNEPESKKSSYSSSEGSSTKKKTKNLEKDKKSKEEEEVICLGKLEKFENLVDDETTIGEINEETCILCDKNGHTSFKCQMICKNCGEKYHNLKMCPKPANQSTMLSHFFEFCLNQCCTYNPNERFRSRNNNVENELFAGMSSSNRESYDNTQNNRKRSKSKTDNYDSSSSTNSNSSNETSKRRRKQHKNKKTTQNINNFPGPLGFPLQYGFNSLLFNQMMGFNSAMNSLPYNER